MRLHWPETLKEKTQIQGNKCPLYTTELTVVMIAYTSLMQAQARPYPTMEGKVDTNPQINESLVIASY